MLRSRLFLAALAVCALPVCGQWPSFAFRHPRMREMPQFTVKAKARCEPGTAVVGEPCAIILELDVDRKASVNDVHVGGLPDDKDGFAVRGSPENLADGKSDTPGHIVKRIRFPVRFLKPDSREVSLTVEGMVGTVQGGSSFFSNFGTRPDPFRVDVQPLPQQGRPANFSGAVGRRFEMKQTLDRDQVRPNDLVTATYALKFDGYCPSNVYPNVEHLSKEFKAYEPKEVTRTGRSVTWTQMLVPRTAQATNTALVSVNFYNPHTKRYEVARAYPLKLTFVSSEAASTENTSVAVTDGASQAAAYDEEGAAGSRALVLRFAPADASPVIATLPPGTPVKELDARNGWRRLETPRAIGWAKGR